MGAGDLAQANVSFPRSPFGVNYEVAGAAGSVELCTSGRKLPANVDSDVPVGRDR
jgi:hypothetical protein